MELINLNTYELKKTLTHFSKIIKLQYFQKLHENMRLQSY